MYARGWWALAKGLRGAGLTADADEALALGHAIAPR
jgi:hypothetical protein